MTKETKEKVNEVSGAMAIVPIKTTLAMAESVFSLDIETAGALQAAHDAAYGDFTGRDIMGVFPVLPIVHPVGQFQNPMVVDAKGKPVMCAEVRGYLLHRAASKFYYESSGPSTAGQKMPPDCYSTDRKTPAVDARNRQCEACAKCAQNRFNSDSKKPCKDVSTLFLLLTDENGAVYEKEVILKAPVSSMKSVKSHLAQCQVKANEPGNIKDLMFFQFYTELTLRVEEKGANKWSVIEFKIIDHPDFEQHVKNIQAVIAKVKANISIYSGAINEALRDGDFSADIEPEAGDIPTAPANADAAETPAGSVEV